MRQWSNKNKTSSWDAGENKKKCDECSWVEKQDTDKIKITPELYSVVTKLCEKIETEWQMLLSGEQKDGYVLLDGYVIPKQEVTGSTVTNLDCIDKEFIEKHKIMATIHSHSNMGVFFSSVDENETNSSLIDYHIVVNNDLKTVACKKVKLPCGLETFQDTSVSVLREQGDIDIQGMDNIKKKEYEPIYYQRDKQQEWYKGPHAISPEYAHMYEEEGEI